MKKLVSLIILIASLLSVCFLSACNNKYSNMQISLYEVKEGQDDAEIDLSKPLEIELPTSNATASVFVKAVITGGGKGVSRKVDFSQSESGAISVIQNYSVEDYTIAEIRANATGSVADVYVRSKEGGKKVNLSVRVVAKVAQITYNATYIPAVNVGETLELKYKNLLKFNPAITNQTEVKYQLMSDYDNVTLDGNLLTVKSGYNLTSNTKKLKIRAWSVAGSNAGATYNSSSDNLRCEFDVYVVKNISINVSYYDISEEDTIGDPISSEADLVCNSGGKYDAVYFKVNSTLGDVYSFANSDIGLKITYNISSEQGGSAQNYLNITQPYATDPSIFFVKGMSKGNARVLFSVGYKNLSFAAAAPVASKQININVKETPVAILLNQTESSEHSLIVYTTYSGLGNNGTEIKFDVRPSNINIIDKKINLKFKSSNNYTAIEYAEFFNFSVNGINLKYNATNGYEIFGGDLVYVKLKNSGNFPNDVARLTASIVTTPLSFNGKTLTGEEIEYYNTDLILNIREGITDITLSQLQLAEMKRVEANDNLYLQNGADGKVYISFNHNDVDLTNVTVSSSNETIAKATISELNKAVRDPVVDKVYYSFHITGKSVGNFNLYIKAPNGYLKTVKGRVVDIDSGQLTFFSNKDQNTNIQYENKITVDGKTITQLAIKNGVTSPILINTRASINSINATIVKAYSSEYDGINKNFTFSETAVSCSSQVSSKTIYFNTKTIGTTVFKITIFRFVSENGVVLPKDYDYYFEVASFVPVINLSLNNTSLTMKVKAGALYENEAKKSVTVSYNTGATKTVSFSSGVVNAFDINVKILGMTDDIINGTKIMSDTERNFILSGNAIAIEKQSATNGTIIVYVSQFSKQTTMNVTCLVAGIETVLVENVDVNNVSLIENRLAFNLKQTQSKQFAAEISNADRATFNELVYQIFEIKNDRAVLTNNNKSTIISVVQNGNNFDVTGLTGGEVILRIAAKDAFSTAESVNVNRLGTSTKDIYITISDGSENNPYYITNAVDFAGIQKDKFYRLATNELNIQNVALPLFAAANDIFTGGLDGQMVIKFMDNEGILQEFNNNYALNNAQIKLKAFQEMVGSDYLSFAYSGLFAKNAGTIKNLILNDVTMSFNKLILNDVTMSFEISEEYEQAYIGVVAGVNTTTVISGKTKTGKISNVEVNMKDITDAQNVLITQTATDNIYNIGILTGRNETIIENSLVKNSLIVRFYRATAHKNIFVGGLAGTNAGVIEGEYSFANETLGLQSANVIANIQVVNCEGYAGGIAGANSGEIKNVKVATTANGKILAYNAGGIVGLNQNGTIADILCIGVKVEAEEYAGGVVAISETDSLDDTNANIKNVTVHFADLYDKSSAGDIYAQVAYVSGRYVGGLVGKLINGYILFGAAENFTKQTVLYANTNNSQIAGLVAQADNAKIVSSFANVILGNAEYVKNGTVVLDDEIKTAAYVCKVDDLSEDEIDSLVIADVYFVGSGLDDAAENIEDLAFGAYTNFSLGSAYIAIVENETVAEIYVYNIKSTPAEWLAPNLSNISLAYFLDCEFDIGSGTPIQATSWHYISSENYGLPVLVKKDVVPPVKLHTTVPYRLELDINQDYFANYEKGIYYNKDATERAILFFNEYAGLQQINTTLNKHYLFDTILNNGIFNLNVLGGRQDIGVSFKEEGLSIVFNPIENSFIIKSITGNYAKLELKIYSIYNLQCFQQVTIYVTYGVSEFNLYNSLNKLTTTKIKNNQTLSYLIDSFGKLAPQANNGDYVVNELLKVKYSISDNKYLVDATKKKYLFNFNGYYFAPENNKYVYIDSAKQDINLQLFDFYGNANTIFTTVEATMFFNYAEIFPDEGFEGVEEFGHIFRTSFIIQLVKKANSLTTTSNSASIESGSMVQLQADLATSWISDSFVNTTATHSQLVNKTAITADDTTDEIRIAITSGDLDVSHMFNITAEISKTNNVLTYDLMIELSDDYDIRYFTAERVFNLRFWALSNSNVYKDFVLTIKPQQVKRLEINHFAKGEKKVINTTTVAYDSTENASSIIIPGQSGILKINLEPYYSDVDYLVITSSRLADGTIITLEQMYKNESNNLYYSLYPRANVVTDGLELKQVSSYNGTGYGYDGNYYIRTLIPSLIALNEYFELFVTGYKDGQHVTQNSIMLQTQYSPGISGYVKDGILIGDRYLLERGDKSSLLAIEVYGYDNQDVKIENIAFNQFISKEKTVRGSYIHYFKINLSGYSLGEKSVTAELYYDNNESLGVINSVEMKFVVVEHVLQSVKLKGVNSNNTISVAIGSSIPLSLDWKTKSGIDKTADINELFNNNDKQFYNGGVEDFILQSFYTHQSSYGNTTTAALTQYKSGENIFPYANFETGWSESLTNYKITAKSATNGITIYFKIYYSYIKADNEYELSFSLTEGDYVLEYSFTLEIYPSTTEDKPLPIYTALGLSSMVAGQNYILMDDITLEEWVPLGQLAGESSEQTISSIASLDGNNKIITIKSFSVPLVDSSNNTVSHADVGLFASVSESTLLKNITIDISQLEEINLNAFSSYVYGTLVADNSGIIYNCEVINLKDNSSQNAINIISEDIINSKPIKGVAGVLAGKNTGKIINSRVGSAYFTKVILNEDNTFNKSENMPTNRFILSAKGDVGGLVATNSGIISSCYIANTSINNTLGSATESKTGGFVADNQLGGRIQYSYIKGMENTISNNQLRAKNAVINSIGNVAGFVYENSGTIIDSYANIYVSSNQSSVAGFVYSTKANSVILRCYTMASINSNDANEAPFVGVDNDLNELGSADTIIDCYYLKSAADNFYHKQQFVKALNETQFAFVDAFNGFTFINENEINGYGQSDIKTAQSNDAIWSYDILTTNNNNTNSKSLFPELTSANQIAISVRTISSEVKTGETTTYEYTYIDKYKSGSANNPDIIRSAEEYNAVFTTGTTGIINGKYARFVDDINFTNIAVKTSENIVLEKSFIDGNGMNISASINTANINTPPQSLGLFGEIDQSVVKNLNLKLTNVSGTNVTYVGGLAGIISNSQIMNINLIAQPHPTENSEYGLIYANNIAGGLAGKISGEKTYISNINSNLTVQVSFTEKTINDIYFSYEYLSDSQYILQYNKAQPQLFTADNGYSNMGTYAEYVKNLSYAGGLAGVIDIDLQPDRYYYDDGLKNSVLRYAPFVNINEININSGTTSRSETGNTTKIIGENAGGIVGYNGSGSYIYRASFLLNDKTFADPESYESYINGNYSAGGIAAQNYGHIASSQIAYDIDTQLAKDSNIYNSIDNSTKINMGNPALIRGKMFVGGFIGINFGGAIENSLTKLSLYRNSARVVGGFTAANIGGAYNSIYTTSLLNPQHYTDAENTLTEGNATVGGLFGINYDYSITKYGEIKSFGSDVNFTTRVHDFKMLLNKDPRLVNQPQIILNKVVLANGYNKYDFINTEGNSILTENATFGLFIGKNYVKNENFLGSLTNNTSSEAGITPTGVYYSKLYFDCDLKDTLVGKEIYYTLEVTNDKDLKDIGLTVYFIKNLLNIQATEQRAVFETLFGTWLPQYWSLNSEYYFPSLIKLGYENFIEIWKESDLQLINDYPDANFVVKDDITLTKIYDTNVIGTLFTGTITGDHDTSGVAPKISGIKIVQGTAGNSVGFFAQTHGTTISNIDFEIDYIISSEKGERVNVNDGSFNKIVTEANYSLGALIGFDTGSTLTNVNVAGKEGGDFKLKVGTADKTTYESGTIVSASQYTGGLIGYGTNTTILNSQASMKIKTDIVQNLTSSSQIDKDFYVGGLIGKLESDSKTKNLIGGSNSLIMNSYFKSSQQNKKYNIYAQSNGPSDLYVGGIAGYIKDVSVSTIDNAESVVIITKQNSNNKGSYTGGIVGKGEKVYLTAISIKPLLFSNTENALVSTYMGGLAGILSDKVNIEKCNIQAGSIIGYIQSNAEIVWNNTTNKTVPTDTHTFVGGGLVASLSGITEGDDEDDEGDGLMASLPGVTEGDDEDDRAKIDNCYANVNISNFVYKYEMQGGKRAFSALSDVIVADCQFGGLVGWGRNFDIIDSFVVGEINAHQINNTNEANLGGLIGKVSQIGDAFIKIGSSYEIDSKDKLTINNHYATVADVLIKSSNFATVKVGGLIGYLETENGINTIAETASWGRIYLEGTSQNVYAGGMIGQCEGKLQAVNCYTVSMLGTSGLKTQGLTTEKIQAVFGEVNTAGYKFINVVYSSDYALCEDVLTGEGIYNLTVGSLLNKDTFALLDYDIGSENENETFISGYGAGDNATKTLPYPASIKTKLESLGYFNSGNVIMPQAVGSGSTSLRADTDTAFKYYVLLAVGESDNIITLKFEQFSLNGLFMGNGHKVEYTANYTTNTSVNDDNYYTRYGLFEKIEKYSAVSNLTIQNNFTQEIELEKSSTNVFYGTVAALNYGTVYMCAVNNTNMEIYNPDDNTVYLGGLVGVNMGRITYSYSTAEIIVNGTYEKVGGIASLNGNMDFDTPVILTIGDETDSSVYYPRIENSYFTGTVYITTGTAGGIAYCSLADQEVIVSLSKSYPYIRNCYSAGSFVDTAHNTEANGGFVSDEDAIDAAGDNFEDFYAGYNTTDYTGVDLTSTYQLTKMGTDGNLNDSDWQVMARGINEGYGRNQGGQNDIEKHNYNFGYPVHKFSLQKLRTAGGVVTGLDSVSTFGIQTGNGTAASPILINNAGILDSIRTNTTYEYYYKIINDIILPDIILPATDKFADGIVDKWVGIGDAVLGTDRFKTENIFEFKGHIYSDDRYLDSQVEELFDGRDAAVNAINKKTLKNFKNSGLVGRLNSDGSGHANISYIIFEDFTNLQSVYQIPSTTYIINGAAVNYMQSGKVEYCEVKGEVSSSNISIFEEYLGGLVGYVNNIQSEFSADIVNNKINLSTEGIYSTNLSDTESSYIGGLVGKSRGNLYVEENVIELTSDINIYASKENAYIGGFVAGVTKSGSEDEEFIEIAHNAISSTGGYQITLGGSVATNDVVGGVVGSINLTDENDETYANIFKNSVEYVKFIGKTIGGIVGESTNAYIYDNTIKTSNTETQLSQVVIFGGIVGVADVNTHIGKNKSGSSRANTIAANFVVISLEVADVKLNVGNNKIDSRGFGLVAGVMIDNSSTINAITFDNDKKSELGLHSGTYSTIIDNISNAQYFKNVGGIVGLMYGGNLEALYLGDNISRDYYVVKGYGNVGGLIGNYNGLSELKLPDFVKLSKSLQFTTVYGLQNVGGIIGRYKNETATTITISGLENKNNVLVYNVEIENKTDLYETLSGTNGITEYGGVVNFGGIVGYAENVAGFSDCINYAIVGANEEDEYKASYANYVGGITSKMVADYEFNQATTTIKKGAVLNVAYEISVKDSKTYGEISSYINNCQNLAVQDIGGIYGQNYVGGIIGALHGHIKGGNSETELTANSVVQNTQKVFGGKNVGGIAGSFFGQTEYIGNAEDETVAENNGDISAVIFDSYFDGGVEVRTLQTISEHDMDDSLYNLSSENIGGIFGFVEPVSKTIEINGVDTIFIIAEKSIDETDITGYIANVINDASVAGINNVGGIIGYVKVDKDYKVLIDNVKTEIDSTNKITGVYRIGGLVGKMSTNQKVNYSLITIQNSTNNFAVSNKNFNYDTGDNKGKLMSDNIGGIVGYAFGADNNLVQFSNVKNCATITGMSNVGGLAGFAVYSYFENSLNSGEVMGDAAIVVSTDFKITLAEKATVGYYKYFERDEYVYKETHEGYKPDDTIIKYEKGNNIKYDKKVFYDQLLDNGIGGIIGTAMYVKFNTVVIVVINEQSITTQTGVKNAASVTAPNMINVGGTIGFAKGMMSDANMPLIKDDDEIIIQGKENVGGLFGKLTPSSGSDSNKTLNGYSESVKTYNTLTKKQFGSNSDNITVKGTTNVGGLVGHSVEISMQKVAFSGKLDAPTTTAPTNVGGLVGKLQDANLSTVGTGASEIKNKVAFSAAPTNITNFGGLVGMLKLAKKHSTTAVNVLGEHTYTYTIDTIENENYTTSINVSKNKNIVGGSYDFVTFNKNEKLYLATTYTNQDKINISKATEATEATEATDFSITRVMQRYIADAGIDSYLYEGSKIEIFNIANNHTKLVTDGDELIQAEIKNLSGDKIHPLLATDDELNDEEGLGSNKFINFIDALYNTNLGLLGKAGLGVLATLVIVAVCGPWGWTTLAVAAIWTAISEAVDSIYINTNGYLASQKSFSINKSGNSYAYLSQTDLSDLFELKYFNYNDGDVEGTFKIEGDKTISVYTTNRVSNVATNLDEFIHNDDTNTAVKDYFDNHNDGNTQGNKKLHINYQNFIYVAYGENKGTDGGEYAKVYGYWWKKIDRQINKEQLLYQSFNSLQTGYSDNEGKYLSSNFDANNTYWSYYSDTQNPADKIIDEEEPKITLKNILGLEEGQHYIKAKRDYVYEATETTNKDSEYGEYGVDYIKTYFKKDKEINSEDRQLSKEPLSFIDENGLIKNNLPKLYLIDATLNSTEISIETGEDDSYLFKAGNELKFKLKKIIDGIELYDANDDMLDLDTLDDYYWLIENLGTRHLDYEIHNNNVYTKYINNGKDYQEGNPDGYPSADWIVNYYKTKAPADIGEDDVIKKAEMYWTRNGLDPDEYAEDEASYDNITEKYTKYQLIYAYWSAALKNYRYFEPVYVGPDTPDPSDVSDGYYTATNLQTAATAIGDGEIAEDEILKLYVKRIIYEPKDEEVEDKVKDYASTVALDKVYLKNDNGYIYVVGKNFNYRYENDVTTPEWQYISVLQKRSSGDAPDVRTYGFYGKTKYYYLYVNEVGGKEITTGETVANIINDLFTQPNSKDTYVVIETIFANGGSRITAQ